MTRHGQRGSRVTAPALWPMEPLVVHTANGANDTVWAASLGLGENDWGRNARPAPSSTDCRAARKPNKAQPEIVKSP